jgi:hypothetical protein
MIVLCAHAQLSPAPGAKLSYTQVMFEYEHVSGADHYVLQLTEDTAGASFLHCLTDRVVPNTASRVDDLSFGRKYKWRYAGITGRDTVWRGPYTFEIERGLMQQLNLFSVAVTINDSSNARGLIIDDATSTISDRRGRTVWYMPRMNWQFVTSKRSVTEDSLMSVVQYIEIRPIIYDLRLTPWGTITYMTDSALVESDLNGKTLWTKKVIDQGPDLGEDNYNHVFMRSPDSHYWTIGKQVWKKIPAEDTTRVDRYLRREFHGQWYRRVEFGTVLEYDRTGQLVWSWNSRKYFDPDGSAGPESSPELAAHINALSVDRTDSFVYVGFRDISRIIRIHKRSGRVVDSWGAKMPWGVGAMHHLDMHQQHDASILSDNTILVYNNNDYPRQDSVPSVLIFSPQDSGRIVWKYNIALDHSLRRKSRTGGNADQLPGGDILVCTGTPNLILEVNRNKKVVWQAEVRAKDIPGYNYSHRLYRAHYTSSLYPYHFTVDVTQDTVSRDSSMYHFTVYNNGSESDSYRVEIAGSQIKNDETVILKPGDHLRYDMPVNEKDRGHEIPISVRSASYPDLVRTREVHFR